MSFLFTKKESKPKIFNFVPSIVFILITSNVWFHPSYSEFLSLFCITSIVSEKFLIILIVSSVEQSSIISIFCGFNLDPRGVTFLKYFVVLKNT